MSEPFPAAIACAVEMVLRDVDGWAFVSPSEGELESFDGRDIDLIVRPERVGGIVAILQQHFERCGFKTRVTRRWEAHQLWICEMSQDAIRVINIDLVTHFQVRGIEYLRVSDLLARAAASEHRLVPDQTHAAYRMLRSGFWGKGDSCCSGEALKSSMPAVAQEVVRLSRSTMGKGWAERLGRHCLEPGTDSRRMWRRALAQLRWRALIMNPMATLSGMVNWRLGSLSALVSPRGMMVALIGVDGSGKSTVATKLVEQAGLGLFGGATSRIFHWRPGVLPKPGSLVGGATTVGVEDVRRPRARTPRGLISSVLRSLYFFLDYWLGYWSNVRPALARGGLVVFDRYGFDIALDPRRYRLSPRLSKAYDLLFVRLIPRPDVTLSLVLPARVAVRRKSELTSVEIEEITQDLRSLSARIGGRELEASRTADEVAAEGTRVLVERYFA